MTECTECYESGTKQQALWIFNLIREEKAPSVRGEEFILGKWKLKKSAMYSWLNNR